ncbi:MAG: type II secretion system F family protein, partial [Planctomycetota bacterium]
MKFSYVAYDAGGSTKRGTVEAASADEARDKLRDDGLFVTEMNASAGGGGASASGDGRETDIGVKRGIRLGGRKRLARLVEFSRQLSLLVSTGTPVADGLRAVERQTKDEDWKNLVREMRTEVESGDSLSDSMASRPNEFDAVARSLVAAGEASGRLDVMLARLAS